MLVRQAVEKALDAAIAEALHAGQPIAVAAADEAGYPLALRTMERGDRLDALRAMALAHTAVVTGRPSVEVGDANRPASPIAIGSIRLATGPGGVPLREGNVVVGALAVSGGDVDCVERCVRAGVDAYAVASMLLWNDELFDHSG
jgi:uncharacterized protein GlcG (DUF336 family)